MHYSISHFSGVGVVCTVTQRNTLLFLGNIGRKCMSWKIWWWRWRYRWWHDHERNKHQVTYWLITCYSCVIMMVLYIYFDIGYGFQISVRFSMYIFWLYKWRVRGCEWTKEGCCCLPPVLNHGVSEIDTCSFLPFFIIIMACLWFRWLDVLGRSLVSVVGHIMAVL